MKKILLSMILILSFIFIGCEDPKPDCEENNTCTVTVINNTGYIIYVDVTWGNSNYNDERLLYNGYSTTYRNLPSGLLTIWASFNADDWVYDDEYVSSCVDFKYTWVYEKKGTPSKCDVPSFDPNIHKNGEYKLVITDKNK